MIIGLTGGIGSGKSTIARQLCKMGYAVYDTDKEAKLLIVENQNVRQQIEQLLGKEAYKDGVYQTELVAQRVFADQSLLKKLNDIVHPAVREDIYSRFIAPPLSYSKKSKFLFIECAILYQAHIDQLCDRVIVINAPKEIRLSRTIARDHSNIDKVRARMHAQDVEEDIQRADIVINNDGSQSIEFLCKEIIKSLMSAED